MYVPSERYFAFLFLFLYFLKNINFANFSFFKKKTEIFTKKMKNTTKKLKFRTSKKWSAFFF